MKSSQFEEKLSRQISERLFDSTPGVQVQVFQAGKKVCDIKVGTTFPYYDLASLTKPIFTVQTLMHAFEQKKWTLESKVKDFVGWFPHETKIVELLTHTSGLVWWLPFYKEINFEKPLLQRWETVARKIRDEKLNADEKAVYSDVGFLTLAFVLEGMFDKPLFEIWKSTQELFYSGTTLEFSKDNKPLNNTRFYAPTEECDWRKRILQGEVHDDNCWALGGVSTHAGLFGSVDDVTWFVLQLRSQYFGISRNLIKSKTTKMFFDRQLSEAKGDWAMGYMMPTPGTASCGRYLSPTSIGHTGFTGTSFWYDPRADISIVILSNRVLLGRDNKSFANLRPEIHNWVIEGLRRS